MEHDKELAVTYAALLLRDCGTECTEASLAAVTQASGLKIPPAYFSLFANFFKDHPVQQLFGASGAAPDVAPAADTGKGKEKAKEEPKKDAGKKEAPKAAEKPAAKAAPVEEEEVAEGFSMDLFE